MTETERVALVEGLRAIRLDRDWTFRELAERLGMSQAIVYRYFAGAVPNERATHKIRTFIADHPVAKAQAS